MTEISILLIEDTADIAVHIQDVLKGQGWSVQLKTRAKAGLLAAKSGEFDVFIFSKDRW